MADVKLDNWQDALKKFFQRKAGNWVVDRSEVEKYHFDKSLPIHVGEFLFSYKNEDKKFSQTHKTFLESRVTRFRPDGNEKNVFKNDLIKSGRHRLLDKLDVDVIVKDAERRAFLQQIGERAIVSPDVVDAHPDLLKRPMWGLIDLEYSQEEGSNGKVAKGVIHVRGFTPIETSKVDPEAVRKAFTQIVDASPDKGLHYWHQVLLATIGHDPENVDPTTAEGFEQLLNNISRLAPLVQDNLFIIEMGPPGTGKTTSVLKSPYASAVTAKSTSFAKVFFNSNTRQPGLLTGLDYLAFDDIQDRNGWQNISAMNANLLQFMNHSTAGQVKVPPFIDANSGCSIGFLGNTKGTSALEDVNQYYANVPNEMRSAQFLDRIAAFIDGHEFSKFGTAWTGLALQGDIFGRFLYELRRKKEVTVDFKKWFGPEFVSFENTSSRCEHAVRNHATAVLKIIYPQYDALRGTGRGMEQPPKQLLEAVLKHAIKGRQNIRSLVSRSGTYQPDETANYKKPISFKLMWK